MRLDSHAALVRWPGDQPTRVIHSQRRREQQLWFRRREPLALPFSLAVPRRLPSGPPKLVGADRCGLWPLSKDGTTLLPSAMAGMPADFVRLKNALSLDAELLSKEAIRTEKPVLYPMLNDPRTDKNAVQFFGDKTFWCCRSRRVTKALSSSITSGFTIATASRDRNRHGDRQPRPSPFKTPGCTGV